MATIEGLSAPIAVIDNDIAIAGYKYYPDTGAGASMYIGGTPNDENQNLTLLTNVMYNWGSKVLNNEPQNYKTTVIFT